MTEDPGFEAGLPVEERKLSDRLTSDRPIPRLPFRAALRVRLADLDPGYAPRPANLWPIVAVCVLSGLLLVVLGGLLSVGGA